MARILNITCRGMSNYNYYEKGNDRYILAKIPYSFDPGEVVSFTANNPSTFTINSIMSGL